MTRETAPRFSGIGGHSCIGCGETAPDKFGRKGPDLGPRSRCKSCTNIENKKSKSRIRAKDPKGYLARHAQYGREMRARRSPETALLIERRGRLKRYGLTLDEFDVMLKSQKNACAICRRPKPDGRQWHIDHNHRTLKVRGILCSNCNTALGLFADNPENLRRAIQYLKRAETK